MNHFFWSARFLPTFLFLLIFGLFLPMRSVAFEETASHDLISTQARDTSISPLTIYDEDSLVELVDQFSRESLVPSNSHTLSLLECVKSALSSSPELASAVASVRESGFLFVAAKNSWNPVFSFNSSDFPRYRFSSRYSNQKNVFFPAVPSQEQERTGSYSNAFSSAGDFQVNATLGWEFLDFSRQPRINAAATQYDAQRYVLVATVRRLVANIQSLYVDLQAQRQLVESYSEIVASLRQNLIVARERHKAGFVSILEVNQSESQLYNSLSQLSSAVQAYNKSSDKLAALVALPAQALIIPADDFSLDSGWHLSLEKTLNYALQNNDNILKTLLLVSSSRWQGIDYLNQALPKFSLNLTAGYSPSSMGTNTSTTQYSSLSSISKDEYVNLWSESTTVSAFLGFSWNIFQGGINTSNAASKFSQSEAYQFDVDNQRNQLVSEIRSNHSALKSQKLNFYSSQKAIETSLDSYRAALARFSVGLDNVTTINQTIQSYEAAIRSRSSSIEGFNTALAELYRDTAIWPSPLKSYVDDFFNAHRY